jgi:cytochrome c oxidase assembly factor CtaG
VCVCVCVCGDGSDVVVILVLVMDWLRACVSVMCRLSWSLERRQD